MFKFLLLHAIELYLKAYLRRADISIADLRNPKKFGHSFVKLMATCEAHGLQLPDNINGVLHLAESLDDPIEARFFRSTARPRVAPSGLYDVALVVRGLVTPHFPLQSRPFDRGV